MWQLNGASEHKSLFLAAHMKDTKTATALGLDDPPTLIRVDIMAASTFAIWASISCNLSLSTTRLTRSFMADFTPGSAAIGGALIGLAAALLMLLTGRIAGISGIFGACLNITTPDKGWRTAFVVGLILAPLAGSFVGYALVEPQMPASWVTTVGGGLLVGFGTRQGGCRHR